MIHPNELQKIFFRLMELASFNSFDGEAVVKDLQKHEDWWRGAIFGRFDRYAGLIPLRDIQTGEYNADTLYMTAVENHKEELELLAKTWSADEVDWLQKEKAESMLGGGEKLSVLRVWWD